MPISYFIFRANVLCPKFDETVEFCRSWIIDEHLTYCRNWYDKN